MYHGIIKFWFSEIDKSKWFVKDEMLDTEMHSRFADVHAQATRCELASWRLSPLGCLAEIIVLDQFSRNLYRGKPESFANDTLALCLAQNAIANGFDSELSSVQKIFLYMPFMHSESLFIHEDAVRLFTELGEKENLEFELKHKAIIEQFGRYPHRNEILGRISTSQEKAFLSKPGSSF